MGNLSKVQNEFGRKKRKNDIEQSLFIFNQFIGEGVNCLADLSNHPISPSPSGSVISRIPQRASRNSLSFHRYLLVHKKSSWFFKQIHLRKFGYLFIALIYCSEIPFSLLSCFASFFSMKLTIHYKKDDIFPNYIHIYH